MSCSSIERRENVTFHEDHPYREKLKDIKTNRLCPFTMFSKFCTVQRNNAKKQINFFFVLFPNFLVQFAIIFRSQFLTSANKNLGSPAT